MVASRPAMISRARGGHQSRRPTEEGARHGEAQAGYLDVARRLRGRARTRRSASARRGRHAAARVGLRLKSFREATGRPAASVNADDEVVAEGLRRTGAVIMGRGCSAAARARGRRSERRAAGGATTRPSACRSSCSPTTHASRRSMGAHDLPLRHRRHRGRRSSRRAPPPATRTSSSPAAATSLSSTCAPASRRDPDPRLAGLPRRRASASSTASRPTRSALEAERVVAVARRHPSPLPGRALAASRRPRTRARAAAPTRHGLDRRGACAAEAGRHRERRRARRRSPARRARAWNPSSSACGVPPRRCWRSRPPATTASTSAPPNWNDVLSSPPASPCSPGATPLVAAMLSGPKASAKPRPASRNVGSIASA